MTYLIIPATTQSEAWDFSAAMWHLGRSYSSSTAYAVGVVQHPDGETFALDLNAPPIYIQPDADIEAFIAILAEPAQDDFRQILQDALGTKANLATMAAAVPFFTDYLRTREQLEADGWFTDPEDGPA